MMVAKDRIAFGLSASDIANSGREGYIAKAEIVDRFTIGIYFYTNPREPDNTYSRNDLRQLRDALNHLLEQGFGFDKG